MDKKKILIVDDERDVTVYLTEVLEDSRFDLHTAMDAETGLNMVKKVHPDLICLDIMMPGESGLSMYTKLRRTKEFRDIPVIIISGVEQAGEFDFRKFVDDERIPPPECYLEKPIDVAEFVNGVERLLSIGDSNLEKGRIP